MQFHFSIGPVQAFIGQSRRTRDLWASSYLLSYLAGRAMAAVCKIDSDNTITLPAVTDGDLHAYGDDSADALPDHATLPNRFVAEVRDGSRAGKAAADAVHCTWCDLANAVWKVFVKQTADKYGHGSAEIWRRQIEHFWQITWVADADAEFLDARKHWRAHPVLSEPGYHCTMMGDYQEVSGQVSERREQRRFWQELRGKVGDLNLRDDERLCAIALVKRLFPKLRCHRLGQALNQVAWPSTLYVAAWPWVRDMCEHSPDMACAYAREVSSRSEDAFSERPTYAKLRGVVDVIKNASDFAGLDGNYMFTHALANANATPIHAARADDDSDEVRKHLLAALRRLVQQAKQTGLGEPSPFYALLLMDGDQLGKLLENKAQRPAITAALTEFARRVPDIVREHQGHTVYAGGDDVLALMPIDQVFAAAQALRHAYRDEFARLSEKNQGSDKPTISAAVVFAHYRLPLRRVLRTAHHLLDDVAKEQCGRASVALSIQKSGGETARWATPWSYFANSADDGKTCIDALMTMMREGHIGASVLYRIRAMLGCIADVGELGPGKGIPIPEGFTNGDMENLIVAELASDRQRYADESPKSPSGHPDGPDKGLRVVASTLLRVMHWRRRNGEGEEYCESMLSTDGAVIAAFLANKGQEEDRT